MEKIIEKELCCGCHACFNACPQEAITMQPDNKGFLYPVINKEKCIDCGICKQSCPVLNNKVEKKEPLAYACFNKNTQERLMSSSGGIFILLAKQIIKKGGVVFGAGFDENFEVCHTFIEKENDIKKLMGSKYVQSDIGDTYKKAKEFLEQDRYVFFSGTPCQTQGLASYLKKDYEKLYLQDIICHGVPSPKAWHKYLQWQKDKYGENIRSASFRNKDRGWANYQMSVSLENKEYFAQPSKDPFMLAFSKSICLRDSCYNCSFKEKKRNADITLADFWGIDKVIPEMNDNKGISLVITNSEKGCMLFEKIMNEIVCEKTDISIAIKHNPSFKESPVKCKNSEQFALNIDKISFDKLVKKYVPKTPFLLKSIYKIVDALRN